LSEVAEQTRISSLYLESIENDEYGILPGGIFNKGFVKSFAKFVGVNEQEALEEYSRLISAADSGISEEPKQYRPEVLTDDRTRGSMMPTLIVAGIILTLMTLGILFGVRYWVREPAASDTAANANRTNANLSTNSPPERAADPASNAPEMAGLKVEFKAVSEAVSLAATSDGKKTTALVNAGSAEIFEPKESLRLSYSSSLALAAQLVINGKAITLPAESLDRKRPAVIEFEINKDNLTQIWNDGAISKPTPAAADTNGNSAGQASTTASAPPATPRATPSPRPSTPAPTPNTARPANRPAATPRPAGTPQTL